MKCLGMGTWSRQKFLIFGLLVGGIFGLVAFSPTIYAIVEPHITINMDPGQTTKPFVINDTATGTEVFSINPDGSFSAGNIVVLHFEQKGITSVPQGFSRLGNLKELAVWQVIREPGVSDNFIIEFEESVTGQVKRTQGTGSTVFGFYTSADRINWNLREGVFGNTPTFLADVARGTNGTPPLTTEFLAFGLANNNADTAGEVKDISGTYIIILPVGYSLERIL